MKRKYKTALITIICLMCINQTAGAKENKSFEINVLEMTLNHQEKEIESWKRKVKELESENLKLGNEVKQLKKIKARVTAYAPLDNKSGMCADKEPTTTSTGTYPKRGIIAVDPKEIPYFTKVNIPGYGIASAEDTGGALRNYNEGVAIDVLVDSYEEAIEWGVQYLDVEIQQ